MIRTRSAGIAARASRRGVEQQLEPLDRREPAGGDDRAAQVPAAARV